MTRSDKEAIARYLIECQDDLVAFNDNVLGGLPYWSGADRNCTGQREVAGLIPHCAETVVVGANAIGKSHLTYSAAVWYAVCRPGSTVLVFSPSLGTLLENSWNGIAKIINGQVVDGRHYKPRIPLEAKISRGGSSRPTIVFPNGSRVIGLACNREENCSGWHGDVFAILEEASGLPDYVYQALGGLCARRTLIVGNPLSTDGGFYSRHLTALENEKKGIPPKDSSRSVTIPATSSPHAHLDHSPLGLADATFLRRKAEEEGRNSAWYRSHVLALFPTSSSEVLIPPEDLDYALSEACRVAAEAYRERVKHTGQNRIVISADVGQGVGKAKSVVLARDEYGVLRIEADDQMGIEETARMVATFKATYNVADSAIVYDGGGDTGTRMTAALKAEGVVNAYAYFGGDMSAEWGKNYANARSAVAYCMARRLARGYFAGLPHGAPFFIPFNADLIEELKALHGVARGDGKSALESKDEVARRLKRSSDLADALAMSFARDARRKV